MESIREIFKIGRGPSSSHTMGPAKACRVMMERYPEADRFEVTLYGSLAKTGRGHRTDYAIEQTFGSLPVQVHFDVERDNLPHPNTMEIVALLGDIEVARRTVCSVGGGTIRFTDEDAQVEIVDVYPETHFTEISKLCEKEGISLYDYVCMREGDDIKEYLADVWSQMMDTVEAGLKKDGIIPGGLGLARKAKVLMSTGKSKAFGHEKEIYMISAYAFAASEENACGEMMVTSPTCGASGVVPAVLYFKQQELGYTDDEIIEALAVAGIVGNIIKTNASISGAECGCQAEVGSACSMAAAAFAYLKGLDIHQIECAAEIAMEHHLGLTCDPVAGLVQIPCIERNAVAAMRAVDAVGLAEMLYEFRKISFDLVVKTMLETGRDLSCRYRETSDGGLAAQYR